MKNLERFVDLCIETWPGEPLTFDIVPMVTGELSLQVRIARWLIPVSFSESDLKDPRAMLRTLKAAMDSWRIAVKV